MFDTANVVYWKSYFLLLLWYTHTQPFCSFTADVIPLLTIFTFHCSLSKLSTRRFGVVHHQIITKKFEILVGRRTAVSAKIDLSKCGNSIRLFDILLFLVKTKFEPTIQAASYVCHMDKTSNDIREFFSVLRGKWRSILRSDVVVTQNLKF